MKSAFVIPDMIQNFRQLALDQGFVTEMLTEIDQHAIHAFRKDSPGTAKIYLSSGVHGDEPAGPLALKRLFDEGFFDERATWLICPLLNPSGLVLGTRENKDGIDLNRDYLSLDTNEVSGHVNWLRQQGSLDLALSLHEDYESTGFYLYEINCIDCPSDAQAVLKAVSKVFPPEPDPVIDDHEVRLPGWIFHEPEADFPDQWPEAIWLAKQGTAISYTFETPSSSGLDQRVDAHCRAVRKCVNNFIERHAAS